MTFGEKVSNRRHELGLSQLDVANAVDVTMSTVCKIEKNQIKPNSKAAKRVAKLLNLDEPINTNFLTGDKDADLAILEKRVTNAIFELEIVLDTLRAMKGENS